jgi:negative regulator of flagellin synthesis FlgM
MKIGSFESKPVTPASGPERKGAAPAAGASAPATAEPSAQVALSPAASALSKAGGDGSFDAQKVERIATAIREGNYRINAEAIADKLIINAEELLGRKFS